MGFHMINGGVLRDGVDFLHRGVYPQAVPACGSKWANAEGRSNKIDPGIGLPGGGLVGHYGRIPYMWLQRA
jgi:hypothetical protein